MLNSIGNKGSEVTSNYTNKSMSFANQNLKCTRYLLVIILEYVRCGGYRMWVPKQDNAVKTYIFRIKRGGDVCVCVWYLPIYL